MTTSAFPRDFSDRRLNEPLLLPDLRHLDIEIDSGVLSSSRLFYPKGGKSRKIEQEVSAALHAAEKEVPQPDIASKFLTKLPPPQKKKTYRGPSAHAAHIPLTTVDPSGEEVIRSLRGNERRMRRMMRKF